MYMETFNSYSQMGQWACSVLGECIYHLAPFIGTANDEMTRTTALTSLLSIHSLMENMSMPQGSARRAQRSLRHILSTVESCDPNLHNMDDDIPF